MEFWRESVAVVPVITALLSKICIEGFNRNAGHHWRIPGRPCAGDPAHDIYLPLVTIRSKSEFPHMP